MCYIVHTAPKKNAVHAGGAPDFGVRARSALLARGTAERAASETRPRTRTGTYWVAYAWGGMGWDEWGTAAPGASVVRGRAELELARGRGRGRGLVRAAGEARGRWGWHGYDTRA